MEERINELELRFMQQELVIQELSDAAYRQEQSIVRLQQELDILSRQLRSIAPASTINNEEEERPPHY